MNHYTIENFKETFKKHVFPDFLKYIPVLILCIQIFINKFMREIDSVALIKK